MFDSLRAGQTTIDLLGLGGAPAPRADGNQTETGMQIEGMNHFTIVARDLETTRRFYTDVLGLEEGPRPPLPFDGAWFYLGGTAVLHAIGRDQAPDPRGGVLDHMAFSATDLARTLGELKARSIEYELIRQVGSGTWQVFFYDPNGAKIELDFVPEESPDA